MFTKALHHLGQDMRTSNACHGFNFHRRDLDFSDIVSKTMTVTNLNFKHCKIFRIWVVYPLKLLDRVVSGVRFRTGGVFECDIAHRRSVAVLSMLSKNCLTRCTLLMVLYLWRVCQRGFVFYYFSISLLSVDRLLVLWGWGIWTDKV